MIVCCPDCGTIQELRPLPPGTVARCPCCEHALEQTTGRSITAALALSTATLLLLIPAYSLPFLSYQKYGLAAESRLGSGIGILLEQQQVLLGIGVLLLAIVVPLVRFSLLTVSLGTLRFGGRPAWLPYIFRWAAALDLWAMVDVFLLATIVGYNRISPYVPLHIHVGAYCFLVAAVLSMLTRAALDRRTVWRAIGGERSPPADGPVVSCITCDILLPASAEGERCPRCRARVHARKPDSYVRTAALVAAGFMLYLPANIYPMSVMTGLGQHYPHTIFWGVERLVQAGLLPLACLIFITSVLFPLTKLVVMAWFLIAIRWRSRRFLVTRTKLHRIVDDLGRWSNMDPFTIAVFAPLIQFGQLVSVHAGIGSPCFFGVVTVSMLASHWFDPRLMWDAAEV